MPRNPEYQRFLDLIDGRIEDTLPKNVEHPAIEKEIGWWKQHQVRRAISHARTGKATIEELDFLDKHKINYPRLARRRIREKFS